MKGDRTESYLSSSTTMARYLEMEKEKDVERIMKLPAASGWSI